jgi:hypothetical protein
VSSEVVARNPISHKVTVELLGLALHHHERQGIYMANFFKKAADAVGLTPVGRATKEERSRLREAEKQEKRIRQLMDHELRSAQQVVTKLQDEYDRRVAVAERALARLENPGTGEVMATLGGVRLSEHAIHVGQSVYSLAGITAQSQVTSTSALLQIRLPNGQTLLERYSTEWRNHGAPTYHTEDRGDFEVIHTNQKKVRDYSEEQVIQLENLINNQVITHKQFVEQLPVMIPEARAQLEAERRNDLELRENEAQLENLRSNSPHLPALEQSLQLVRQRRLEYENARRRFEGHPEVSELADDIDLSDDES